VYGSRVPRRLAIVLVALAAVLSGVGIAEAVVAGPIRPNHRLTPGATFAGASRTDVCTAGWSAAHRNVSASMRRSVFVRYHLASVPKAYEVDHLISLELGGSNDIKNLWPEKYAGTWGARTKDRLENRLHSLVCKGTISLATAQHEIAGDWIASFKHRVG
jgi:hypothetical protein